MEKTDSTEHEESLVNLELVDIPDLLERMVSPVDVGLSVPLERTVCQDRVGMLVFPARMERSVLLVRLERPERVATLDRTGKSVNPVPQDTLAKMVKQEHVVTTVLQERRVWPEREVLQVKPALVDTMDHPERTAKTVVPEQEDILDSMEKTDQTGRTECVDILE
jgi:hypothetical protein